MCFEIIGQRNILGSIFDNYLISFWCTTFFKGENPELPLGKYLYEDLKCDANTEGDNHPAYYKCDVSSKDKCIFEGKKLLVGEEIKDNGTDVYCRSHCSCNEE